MRKYKLTPYNVFKKTTKNENIIYNTLSEAIYKVDDDFVDKLSREPMEIDDNVTINELIKSYIICEVESDETSIFQFANRAVMAQTKDIGIVIVPSRTCNLRCVYCVQNNLFSMDEKLKMDENDIDEMVSWLKRHTLRWKTEVIHLIFYGGEPLTATPDILEYMLEKMDSELTAKISIEMVTNGTMIINHRNIMNRIDEYRVTIDGIPEVHNARRKYANDEGSYNTIIDNLKEVINHNNHKLTIRINVDKSNRDYLIDTVEKIMSDLSVSYLQFVLHPVQPYGKDITTRGLHDDLQKTAAAMVECSRYLKLKGITVSMWKMNCGVTSMGLWVFDTDGSIYKCLEHIGRAEDAVTTVKEEYMYTKFYEIMNRSYDDECKKCKYLGICLGGCYHQMEMDGVKQCYRVLFDHYVPEMLEIQYK